MAALTILGGICVVTAHSALFASSPPSSISVELIAGDKAIDAWVVFAQEELEQGLSGVLWLGENEGMIFVLPKKTQTKFHMKGVTIPLSIAYLNWRGKILKIEDMEPKTPERIYEAPDGTRYALEMNQGWFERNGLKEGDRIRRKS
ncbi:MAG: hypothetical protein A2Z83_09085 [Omnitrophica bacterium GWA2_52_8]|nr:MAG: hypothetical protein A2Z83_09085 [Omnitrophica bacterium GWA2_52_8]